MTLLKSKILMMIGNDIIDRGYACKESNWRRKGFLKKIFTPCEQELIHGASDPFTTVWRLWSMKESAYKLFMHTGVERFFNPRRLSCEFSSSEEGLVNIEALQIHTRSKIHPKFIFTSASSICRVETMDHVFNLSKTDPRFQSKFTHRAMLECIAQKYHLNKEKLYIRKSDQSVPEVFYGKQRLNISVSMTHHGYHGAFSICERKFIPQ
ncbi:4'-phosphopantetheinyl transferase superfamily protein [Membranicola marinus]|uniref:4'-phosphopantetheinyl transferase superfamily protein n=1 Tax=Membranihabitans marinus TaxID=1227546 RepID=A0A953HXQ8_9BACT|nr:4'-phosphopantetheinyl transferase superfamily protein [Membranihabitans marinus]MBY5958576.1 4'-phosphopantetheinyl transferase superfamily protein [Membranihabitans marinus]